MSTKMSDSAGRLPEGDGTFSVCVVIKLTLLSSWRRGIERISKGEFPPDEKRGTRKNQSHGGRMGELSTLAPAFHNAREPQFIFVYRDNARSRVMKHG